MTTDQSTHLPRLLCLHGGGVTAEIFKVQLRTIFRLLTPHFRLVFPDGPFLCNAGPGMIPVFSGMGPYRRWVRWLPSEHPEIDDAAAVEEIEYALQDAMREDDLRGGRGEWVGLIGFSQGGKIAASILYDSELRLKALRKSRGMDSDLNFAAPVMELSDVPPGIAGGRWRFAVIMAGRAPLVKLSDCSKESPTMLAAGDISEGGEQFDYANGTDRLSLPTLHVHGRQDPGIHLHRRLLDYYCQEGSSQLIEWDGGHRVPLKTVDNEQVCHGILQAAKKAGVISKHEALGVTT